MADELRYPGDRPPRAKPTPRAWAEAEVGRLMGRRMRWVEDAGGQAFLAEWPGGGCRLTLLYDGRRETYHLTKSAAATARKDHAAAPTGARPLRRVGHLRRSR
jgi:hypothetical protein